MSGLGGSFAAFPRHHAAQGYPPRAEEEFVGAAVKLAGLSGVVLGWRPDEFWGATPAELGAVIGVLGGDVGAAPPDRDTITRLREAFPDG